MVDLWVYKVVNNIFGTTINDVPERYISQVKDELDRLGFNYNWQQIQFTNFSLWCMIRLINTL